MTIEKSVIYLFVSINVQNNTIAINNHDEQSEFHPTAKYTKRGQLLLLLQVFEYKN